MLPESIKAIPAEFRDLQESLKTKAAALGNLALSLEKLTVSLNTLIPELVDTCDIIQQVKADVTKLQA